MADKLPEAEFFNWLVDRRSENQKVCLDLYLSFDRYSKYWEDPEYSIVATNLVAIGFSLWRAVFLGHNTGDKILKFTHAREFLSELIKDNTIVYGTDKRFNEWSFGYYLGNAAVRLHIFRQSEIFSVDWTTLVNLEPRQMWERCNELLGLCIATFNAHFENLDATAAKAP